MDKSETKCLDLSHIGQESLKLSCLNKEGFGQTWQRGGNLGDESAYWLLNPEPSHDYDGNRLLGVFGRRFPRKIIKKR